MDSRDLRGRKSLLETDLTIAIKEMLQDFTDETGLHPCDIDLQFVEESTMSSTHKEYRFIRASVRVEV